jgi:3-hydroxy-9,10-secoandrosta-1,3,5(10)-triene-9,17-dione monooxygenase reductase component
VTFDAARFRHVLGHFCSGVAVVTGIDDGEPVGLTVQSFTSLSLDPPLVLFCPAKSSTSWARMRAAAGFCVNILEGDQEPLCRTFATRGGDKFVDVGWTPAPTTGAPVLEGALAWVDCRLDAEHEGGDHSIVVGRVLDLGLGLREAEDDGRPLLFSRGGFGRFEP